MKRIHLSIIAIVLMGITAACGSDGAGGASVGGGNKDVALILGTKGSPFFEAVECGARAKAKEVGVNLSVSAPDQFSPDAQIPVVQAVKAQRPAVAIATATDAQALIRPINDLADNGTKVIMFDQAIADNSKVTAQIISDNEEGGRMAAAELGKAIGGKGAVLTIAAPPGSAADDARRKGFDEGIKQFPEIKNLGPQYHINDPQKVAQIVTSTFNANPDLRGIFATGDQGVIGVLTGVRQAKATDKIQVVGYDAATAEVDALKNGEVAALIVQNPREFGELAVQAASDLIAGKHVEKELNSPLVVVRRGENDKAEQYEYKGDC